MNIFSKLRKHITVILIFDLREHEICLDIG
jgi:hypothetical protein